MEIWASKRRRRVQSSKNAARSFFHDMNSLCRMRKNILDCFFLAGVILLALIVWRISPCHAEKNEIPVQGAVYHVQRSDASHHTYFDIVIGNSFEGKLPEDIAAITVAGPEGPLSIGKADFNHNPEWRSFWCVLPGFPKIGRYTFEVAGQNSHGSAVDIHKITRTIPLPDVSGFQRSPTESNACRSPLFSWPKIKSTIPLYYQLEIRDQNRNHLFRTDYIRDMTEVRIPPDILPPGIRYQWRVRVADGPDWLSLDNRSQSRWVNNIRSKTPSPCAYQYRVPEKAGGDQDVSSLEEEGVRAAEIADMMQTLINGDIPDIHSVLIINNDRLVLEEYLN